MRFERSRRSNKVSSGSCNADFREIELARARPRPSA